jgi:phosphatidylserine/phosphatidylglycerophosphate/cardiolipin synthase-like enzyme
MFKFFSKYQSNPLCIQNSKLCDEKTFYPMFLRDLNKSSCQVIIESPFITSRRMVSLMPILTKLVHRGVKVIINTRPCAEHDAPFDFQATNTIDELQTIGVQILFTGNHHRKVAIIDQKILWEGSLNILSQNDSCEIMRRTDSSALARQMIDFLKLDKFLR